MTRKKPTDDMFSDGLSLHKFAYMAYREHASLLIDGDAIVLQSTEANAKKVEECLVATIKIGVSCSVDSPPQRMKIEIVVNELQRILDVLLKDVEPKEIIIDPDQPMWESAKTVAPTPNSAIIQPTVDNNFVINNTHLNMIQENKFDGYLRADPHDHIREFLAICNMFRYGETQSEAVKLLIFPFSFLNEELQDMRKKYYDLKDKHASKNSMNDDTPMCERHEANYIQSEGNKDRNSHESHSHQSHHDRNDFEKSLTELNNDVKNDLEDFKRCICSMRIDYDKLYDKDDRKTAGVLPNKKSKPVVGSKFHTNDELERESKTKKIRLE
ncbi:hypothetical protein Tco_0883577 [Tanacetum coccineum]